MNLQREAWPFERDRNEVESRSSFLIEQALHKRGTRSDLGVCAADAELYRHAPGRRMEQRNEEALSLEQLERYPRVLGADVVVTMPLPVASLRIELTGYAAAPPQLEGRCLH